MPNDTPKLKPCPCCGQVAFVQETFWGKFYVECWACGLRTENTSTEPYAVHIWNRRTHD